MASKNQTKFIDLRVLAVLISDGALNWRIWLT